MQWRPVPLLCLFALFITFESTHAIQSEEHYTDDAIADEVKSLPGWAGPLPSKWFSGMLPITESMFSHYIYVQRSIATTKSHPAPLVLWSNGGPGASSMFGLFTELGPLVFSGEKLESGVPVLVANPYSWASVADLLIFDAPPPIGFSYCNPPGPAGPGTACGDWDDSRTTSVNLLALKAFLQRFPALTKRQLFLAGESYAGVYIPSLARAILEAQVSGDAILSQVAFKGFAVGDACVGTDVLCGDTLGPYFDVEFLGGHHQFSRKLYHQIFDVCGESGLKSGVGLSPACHALLDQMSEEVGGYYEYALYDDCTYSNPFSSFKRLGEYGGAPGYTRWRKPQTPSLTSSPPRAPPVSVEGKKNGGKKAALNDYACGAGEALFEWVTLQEVRSALHVELDANWFCADNANGFVYTLTEHNLMPFYLQVLEGKYAHLGLRVLVYNGDTDPSVNSLAAENWTSALGLSVSKPWRPWTIDACRRVGGYVTSYGQNFNFLTIRGAGHMVPEYKAAASLAFFSNWILDLDFGLYNDSCTSPPRLNMLERKHAQDSQHGGEGYVQRTQGAQGGAIVFRVDSQFDSAQQVLEGY